MNKIRLIFNYEFFNILRSRSFILALVLIPLAGLIVILVVSALQRNNQTVPFIQSVSPVSKITVVGIVDQSGLIQDIPDELAPLIKTFPESGNALAAVEAQEISGYYVIPQDYLETGEVLFFKPDFNPLSGDENHYLLINLLEVNLLKDNPQLVARFQQPYVLETNYLSGEPQRDPNSALTFYLPYGITMLFYFLILGSSSTMLSSITNEKQNRVMEILLTSITPTQMLTGKIIALGVIGLLQTVVYAGAGFFLLGLSKTTFQLPPEFSIPPSVLIWGIIFFLLGYAIYASLMAGVGAMVPNLRESSQSTFFVMVPAMLPLFFINTLVYQPNGTIAMIMSLFPLTAPIAMMTRLGAVSVPLWQLLLAALLQLLTAIFIIRGIAGMFRAQNLLAGQKFNPKVFMQALVGKA